MVYVLLYPTSTYNRHWLPSHDKVSKMVLFVTMSSIVIKLDGQFGPVWDGLYQRPNVTFEKIEFVIQDMETYTYIRIIGWGKGEGARKSKTNNTY